MLNELMQLSETLKAVEVDVAVRHPDIKPLAKRPILRVFLSPNSRVDSLAVIGSEDAPKYWSIRDGKHNSFPHVSLKKDATKPEKDQPLRPGITGHDRKALHAARLPAARLALLEKLRDRVPINLGKILSREGLWPGVGHRERIKQRAELVERSGKAPEYVELSRRFLDADSAELLVDIEHRLYAHLTTEADNEGVEVAIALSFDGGCDFLFDCQTGPSSIPAASPKSIPAVSMALSSSSQLQPMTRTPSREEKCGLSGAGGPLVDDKFPEANLPLLGPTFLHAKNDQTPCTLRYGVTGPRAMPVARDLASVLQASVEELTSPPRKDKTWRSIAAEKPKTWDLLIAFIDKQPDAAVADGLIANEAEFMRLAERSCLLVDGRPASIPPDARLEIVILRKLDPANKKVIYRASRSVDAFAGFAMEWRDGLNNAPPIRLYAPSRKRGEKPHMQSPPFIAPGSVVAILRRVFTHRGMESTEVTGPSFADAFRLFTTEKAPNQRNTLRMLSSLLTRSGALLAGVAHAQSRPLAEFQIFDRLAALEVVSFLGILLFKLDQAKGEYMTEFPYHLGQLLAGADVLHRGYCLDQRGGSIPPSLLGNSLLPLAQKDPASALAQLSTRLKVYYGWADRARSMRNFKSEIAAAGTETPKGKLLQQVSLGAWMPVRMREIAPELSDELSSSSRPDDIFRAKLLLGYLAGLQKSSAKEAPQTGDESRDHDRI